MGHSEQVSRSCCLPALDRQIALSRKVGCAVLKAGVCSPSSVLSLVAFLHDDRHGVTQDTVLLFQADVCGQGVGLWPSGRSSLGGIRSTGTWGWGFSLHFPIFISKDEAFPRCEMQGGRNRVSSGPSVPRTPRWPVVRLHSEGVRSWKSGWETARMSLTGPIRWKGRGGGAGVSDRSAGRLLVADGTPMAHPTSVSAGEAGGGSCGPFLPRAPMRPD